MPKRYGNLYEKVYNFQNLILASALARRGKRKKIDVCNFEYNLEENIIDIQDKLKNENYKFSDYEMFLIKEPKERLISKAIYKDRVVHHALCNVIEPILDKAMIYDSYACRTDKGTHKAIKRAHYFLRQNKWVLKIDIKKYFFTIDHKILFNLIKTKIKDNRLLYLISKLLYSYKTDDNYYYSFDNDDLFSRTRERGLPIGNLTSQLFANFFLTTFDRYVKEDLKIKGYLRYMDDMLIFCDSKERLNAIKAKAINFLNKMRLKISENKTQLFPQNNGIRFLGFHIYKNGKKILRANLIRFKKRFKNRAYLYENKKILFENLLLSLNSWIGYANKEENRKIINKILENIKIKHIDNDYKFNFIL